VWWFDVRTSIARVRRTNVKSKIRTSFIRLLMPYVLRALLPPSASVYLPSMMFMSTFFPLI
jgi:hypothetical protein